MRYVTVIVLLSVYLSDAIGTLRTGIDAKTQRALDELTDRMIDRQIADGVFQQYHAKRTLQMAGRDRF